MAVLTSPYEDLSKAKFHEFFDSTQTLDYAKLLAYRLLEPDIPEGLPRRRYYSILALLEAHVGNYYRAIEVSDMGKLQPTTMIQFDSTGKQEESLFYPTSAYASYPDSLIDNEYEKINFMDYLQNIEDSVQVVALNEVHAVSLFRGTLYRILPLLKKKGFHYLVLETLYQEDQATHNTTNYPVRTSGYFSAETILGDVIRRAKELGFELISYDAQGLRDQKIREEQSYQRIMKRTFEKDPAAKIILFAGHNHISEGKGRRYKNIGQLMKENDKNPLTFHQYHYYERNAPEALEEATLIRPKDYKSLEDFRYDFTLLLPRSTPSHGRPDWILQLNRSPVQVDQQKIKSHPALVEAFFQSEPDDAVPLDRIEVTDVQQKPYLLLRKGAYRIRITDHQNNFYEYDMVMN